MRARVASAILAGVAVLAPVVAGYAPASSKSPFTITNDPVQGTVIDTMQQRTCTGTVVVNPWHGFGRDWSEKSASVKAVFYRKPDGTAWIAWSQNPLGPMFVPVSEFGVSAQWNTVPYPIGPLTKVTTRYAVYPIGGKGDNHLHGISVQPDGTIDLTCEGGPG